MWLSQTVGNKGAEEDYVEHDLETWGIRKVLDFLEKEEGLTPDYMHFEDDAVFSHPHGLEDEYIDAWRGLFVFVHHSDADGFHSIGDCVDIMEMFKFIEPVKQKCGHKVQKELNCMSRLYSLATELDARIVFC
jgi:hypothetical protein